MADPSRTDDILRLNETRWDAAHQQARFRPRFPHDQVVRWAFRNFSRDGLPPRMLDLGTGAGRHAMFLAAEGFACSACDLSAEGLKEVQRIAAGKGLSIATHQCSADDLSGYASGSFDGIVCFGVLYYMSHAQIAAALAEMHRILKPGGRVLIVTRSDADDRLRGARHLGPFTYMLEAVDPNAPSTFEQGLPMVFLPAEEVRRLMAAFEIRDLGRMRVTHDGFSDDDWVIDAVRPIA